MVLRSSIDRRAIIRGERGPFSASYPTSGAEHPLKCCSLKFYSWSQASLDPDKLLAFGPDVNLNLVLNHFFLQLLYQHC
jgi:hypothetical protein